MNKGNVSVTAHCTFAITGSTGIEVREASRRYLQVIVTTVYNTFWTGIQDSGYVQSAKIPWSSSGFNEANGAVYGNGADELANGCQVDSVACPAASTHRFFGTVYQREIPVVAWDEIIPYFIFLPNVYTLPQQRARPVLQIEELEDVLTPPGLRVDGTIRTLFPIWYSNKGFPTDQGCFCGKVSWFSGKERQQNVITKSVSIWKPLRALENGETCFYYPAIVGNTSCFAWRMAFP